MPRTWYLAVFFLTIVKQPHNKLREWKFSKWIEVLLMWTIGSSSIAPVVHGWRTSSLYSVYFWICEILTPMEWSGLRVTIRAWHTTHIHLCMCVQEKLNVRMEVQSKELEKILNTFVWFYREIFISYSPAKSDELNWRNLTCWLQIVELERTDVCQSLDAKWYKYQNKKSNCFPITNVKGILSSASDDHLILKINHIIFQTLRQHF